MQNFLLKYKTVSKLKKETTSSSWVSRKELLSKFDESEAEELVEKGAIKMRKHPDNSKRFQYRVVTETSATERSVDDKFTTTATTGIDQQTRVNVEGSNNIFELKQNHHL